MAEASGNNILTGVFGERPNQFRRWTIGLAMAIVSVLTVHAQERFDTLRIGVITYSNVLVLNKTPDYFFITHAQGLSNIKVRDLDGNAARQLGYLTAPKSRASLNLPTIEVTPEVERLQAKFNDDIGGRITGMPPAVLAGYVAGMLILYLFTCICCKLICEKAGAPSKFLVWLPGFQIFPLFRAAKMRSWLALGMFGPFWSAIALYFVPKPLNVHDPKTMILAGAAGFCLLIPFLLHCVWCFRIAKAREKSGFVGFALLFPPTSFMTFLYLAFSEGKAEAELPPLPRQRPNYVTFS